MGAGLPPTHEEIAELLGAYALDAVDRDEAEAVEAHLADCPRCRDELAGHREVAAAMAFAGAPAPEGLWAKVAARLAPEAVEPPVAGGYPLSRRSRFSRRRSVRRWEAAVVAAVAAAVIGVLGVQVHSQGRQLHNVQRAQATAGLNGAFQAALVDPTSTKVHLVSVDSRIHVDAVLEANGTGYLVGNDLPALAADRTYQLWGVVAGRKVSLGVLGVHPALVAFRASIPVVALAVTDEAAPGVVASQQTPVVAGTVPGATA